MVENLFNHNPRHKSRARSECIDGSVQEDLAGKHRRETGKHIAESKFETLLKVLRQAPTEWCIALAKKGGAEAERGRIQRSVSSFQGERVRKRWRAHAVPFIRGQLAHQN
jgi:hypothetical protein